jgi:hypothetical protein
MARIRGRVDSAQVGELLVGRLKHEIILLNGGLRCDTLDSAGSSKEGRIVTLMKPGKFSGFNVHLWT